MLSPDLLLSVESDIEVIENDLLLTTQEQTLRQRIKQALLTFKGEWFLNENIGIPYYQEILGSSGALKTIKAIFIDAIQKIEGVSEVTSLALDMDNPTRTLSVKFSVLDEQNNQLEIEI